MTTVDTLVQSYLARLETAAVRLPTDRREELLEEIREHIDGARAAGAAADEAAVRTLLDRLGDPEEIVASAAEDAPSVSGSAGRSALSAPPYGDEAGPYASPYAGRPGPGRDAQAPSSTTVETAACLMLTVGSLLPVVGWLVGVVLLWSSRRWRVGEKVLGTLVIPGGPGLLLYLGAVIPSRTCFGSVSGTAQVFSVGPGGSGPDSFPVQVPAVDAPSSVPTHSCSGGLPLPGYVTASLLLVGLVAPVVVAVLLHRRARARAASEPAVTRREAQGGAWGGLEVAAVLLIGLGSFVVPVVGTLAGLVCLFLSQRWTSHEKTVAAVLTVVPALLGLLLVTSLFLAPLSFHL